MEKKLNPITVVIYSYNSQDLIEECIKSARLLTDDVLLIDQASIDQTAERASRMNVRVETVAHYHYVEPIRAHGIRAAHGQWVFILDADERISANLADEIKQIIHDDAPHEIGSGGGVGAGSSGPSSGEETSPIRITHYKVPRKNMFARKAWLQHGGWWPDHQMRLIHVPHFKTWPERIHSTPEIDGELGYLSNPLTHYFHGDIEIMVNKTILFEGIESDLLFKADRPVSISTFFRKFAGELYRRLIKQQGYLDGGIGIIESVYQAFSKTITYLYLYEKKKSRVV